MDGYGKLAVSPETASVLISAIRIAIVLAITAQLGYAGQGTWTSGGPYGGDVMAVAIDPSTPATVYTGTDGGGSSNPPTPAPPGPPSTRD